MDKKTTSLFAIFIVIALAVGFFAGQWQGKTEGEKIGSEKLQPLVDSVFPEPPANINVLTGIVKGVSGATIALEINAIDDYLPHLDGSPRRMETRFAVVTPSTKIISMNGETGNSSAITLQNIKTGDVITVVSAENIRNAERFDAAELRIVK
ncbi:MAG: hypothetical protein AAB377_03115 [Patescibacteria group bacterium]